MENVMLHSPTLGARTFLSFCCFAWPGSLCTSPAHFPSHSPDLPYSNHLPNALRLSCQSCSSDIPLPPTHLLPFPSSALPHSLVSHFTHITVHLLEILVRSSLVTFVFSTACQSMCLFVSGITKKDLAWGKEEPIKF